MHLISYISDYAGDADSIDSVLDDIVSVSRRLNQLSGITGVLFFHGGKFVQVIEGEEPDLRQRIARIERDPRHRNLTYLIDTPVEKRGFADWNMDSFNLMHRDLISSAELMKIQDAYRANLIPRSNTLVDIYKLFVKQGIFRDDTPRSR